MLESLVASVLNRVVGAYVENFDPKQLNIGLLSGDVKLRNLKMKRSALDKLHLPLKVSEGQIGSLILQIPYSNLKNKPVKVLIEDVLVLAEPDLFPDDKDYVQRMQTAKLDKLELWEVAQSAQPEQDPNAPQTASFVTKVIDNLQVTIKNIHIRYEDFDAVPAHPFACGVSLGELSAVSTTALWEPAFISDVGNTSHKLATLDSFAIYWDTDAKKMEMSDLKERITDMNGQYILKPVNGQGYITLNKRPTNESTPKIDADLQFEELALGLEGSQYRDLIAVADQFQLFFRTREYRVLRPTVSAKEDPKAWWRYAGDVVLKNVRERSRIWNWDNFNQRIEDMREYMPLYAKQYQGTLSATERALFDQIEERYSFDDLVMFRSMAKVKFPPPRKQQAASSWSSWLGWGQPQAQQNAQSVEQSDGPVEITPQQRQELMSIFDETPAQTTKNQILLGAKVSLQSGSIRLKHSGERAEEHSGDVAALYFSALKANVIQRSDNVLFGLSLDSFGVEDLTPTPFKHIIQEYSRPKADGKEIAYGSPDGQSLFWLMFEHHPLDGAADSILNIRSQSVKILWSAVFVEELVRFFAPPVRSQAVDAIVDAATRTVEELREQTRLGLEYALLNHKSLQVKLDIDAPIIVVPEDPHDQAGGVLVLDMGHLSLESELAPKETIEEFKQQQSAHKDWHAMEKLMFDKFRISLVDAQILIGPRFHETIDLLSSGSSPYHLLNKTNFSFLLLLSIVPQVVSIPRCKVEIDLAQLALSFADVQYKQFMRTLQSAVPNLDEGAQEEPPSAPGDALAHRKSVVAAPKPSKPAPQVLFELSFLVKQAELQVKRGWNDKIASICLHAFAMTFKKKQATMVLALTVDDFMIEDFLSDAPVELRKFIESEGHAQALKGAEGTPETPSRLLQVDYRHEEPSGEQWVDVQVAAVKFIVNPTTILSVYDYIMSTFASPDGPVEAAPEAVQEASGDIHVSVVLKSVNAKINEEQVIISSLELASLRLTVDILGAALKLHCVLGAVSIVDEVNQGAARHSVVRQLVGIEGGGDLAEVRYETVPTDEYDAYVYFRTGSLQISMVEEPCARLLRSLSKLLQMKAVYDQARTMAFNQAMTFETPERMKLDVVLKAPIVLFPRVPSGVPEGGEGALEVFRLNLGEIYVQNAFVTKKQTLKAGFRNLKVSSDLYFDGHLQTLSVLENADLVVEANIEDEIAGSGSLVPVQMDVTEHQYKFVLECADMLGRIAGSADVGSEVGALRQQLTDEKSISEDWELPPIVPSKPLRFKFEAPLLQLRLYHNTAGVRAPEDLKAHELSLFNLESTSVELENKGQHTACDVSVKAFTVNDSRKSSDNKFSEIIPSAGHDDCQFRARYTMDEGRVPNLDVSLDGLKVILALDYLLAVKEFAVPPTATDALMVGDDSDSESEDDDLEPMEPTELSDCAEGTPGATEGTATESTPGTTDGTPEPAASPLAMTVQVSILNMYIYLLADAARHDSQAIVFKVEHIVAALGRHSSLGIHKVGMYLTLMNAADQLRLLDDFNITASAETVDSSAEAHLTKIMAEVDPFVFRVSLSEVLLAIAIFNKASALWAPTSATVEAPPPRSTRVTHDGEVYRKRPKRPQTAIKVLGEQMMLKTSGFRAVVIDTNHIPMLDFNIKPFNVRVHNWSSDLSADGSLEAFANVYSFSKSAWEPLLDQLNLFFHVSKPAADHAPQVNVQCKDVTNFEITSELIDMAQKLQDYFSQDPENIFSEGRFGDGDPYRIVNQTGYPIKVWSETADSVHDPATIPDGETVPWSFYDWRHVREVLGGVSQQVAIGVELEGSPFDPLHNVNVNIIGEHLHILKGTPGKHRIAVEISVKDGLKIVVLRSTICIANETQVPLDLRLVRDSDGYQIERTVAAGSSFAAPILDVNAELFVRPHKGNYGWSSQSIWWRDLRKREYGVECFNQDGTSFTVHAVPYYPQQIPLPNHYPYMQINLVAPIELINNLPFDAEYNLYCEDTRRSWKDTIKRGERLQVHVVNRGQLLMLSLDCPSAGYKGSSAIINSRSPDFNVEHRMELKQVGGQSSSGQGGLAGLHAHRLWIDIGYVAMPQNKGTAIVLMAPYIIENLTGRKLTVATRLNRVLCAPHQMWSFEHPDNKNKATLRLDDSRATEPINFTAVGTTSEVAVPDRDRHRQMHLGISLSEGVGRYKRTNIVKVAPRYVIYNKLGERIKFKEPGEVETLGTLEPEEHTPVPFISTVCNRQLCLGLSGKWSAAFVMSNVGTTHVRVQGRDERTVLVKVTVVLEEATLFIYLSQGSWPYTIRNLTELPFEFWQVSPQGERSERGSESRPAHFEPIRYDLAPRTQMPYSWDYPSADVKELHLQNGGKHLKVQLAEIGELEPQKFRLDGHVYPVAIKVSATEEGQVLVLMPFEEAETNYELSRTDTRATARSGASTSTSAPAGGFKAKDADDNQSAFHLQVEIEGVGVSYINRNHQEFCYAIVRNVTLIYRVSDLFEYVACRCQWIQVDNSLAANTRFPVMLYPTVLPRNGDEIKQHPVFSAACTRLKGNYGLSYIKHATVLLQELTIDLDEDILVSVLQMVKHPSEGEVLRSDNSVLFEDCATSSTKGAQGNPGSPSLQLSIPTPPSHLRNDLYFELLHLQPVQVNVSFERTGALSETDLFGGLDGGIGYILDAASMALANIDDAPIKMNAMMIENLRTTQDNLQSCIVTHYSQELLYQVYKIVGSADLFGNPVGLFNNLSSGVMDLFYEPYLGYTATDRPQDIGIGIAKGGASFMKKTVFGVSDSISKVTGSVSKGLQAATMDQRYQTRQRNMRIRNRPGNALDGFGYGATSFANNLFAGISGLALAPLEGATAQGASGFFKGMGKGLLGLPTKTAVGVLEFASNLSEGVRNNTTMFDNSTILRTRPPRVINRDTIVRPYSERDAIGQQLLHTMCDSKYKKDQYLAHTQLASGEFIIVSFEHILCLKLQGLQRQWAVSYSQLKGVKIEAKGIQIALRDNMRGPFIAVPSKDQRDYLARSIKEATEVYNEQKALQA